MKKIHKQLIFLFFFVLGVRIFFAISTTQFTGDEAYHTLRQVSHITETGLPLFHDPLSQGGRFTIFPPLFYYLLAFFDIFLPLIFVAKIIPNVLASTLVFIIYAISLEITKKKNISFLNAFIAGFIPIFFKETINNISIYSLTTPLIFLSLFFFITLHKYKHSIHFFFVSLILLMLTHPSSMLLALGLLLYLILIRAINLQKSDVELEIILFSSFIVLWFSLLLFKNAFLVHGYAAIWQNTPSKIFTTYFFDIGILESIYAIGIIPFIFGIYIIYSYTLKKRKRIIYLFTGMSAISFILLWFKFIKPTDSLIILGISLVILSSQFYKDSLIFISKTKIPFKKFYLTILVLIIILTSFLPSISYAKKEMEQSLTGQEQGALQWIKENTPKNSTIASFYKEGHLITSISGRKNFIDQNFILVKNINQRFNDHEVIYTSKFSTPVVRITTKYNIDYIYFSPKTKKILQIKEISYIDENCFPLVYDKGIKIYKVACTI